MPAKSTPPNEHRLPKLIELADLRGDLQMHTTASDGKHSIEEMAAGGARRSATSTSPSPITAKRSPSPTAWTKRARASTIAQDSRRERRRGGIRILAGIEVDILKDGRLDLADEVLAELDVVVASMHSYMNLERAK